MKKKIRSFVLLLTVLALLFGLTACGEPTESEAKPSELKAEGKSAAEDEYVYHAEFKKIADGFKSFLNPRIFTDDGFYATAYEKLRDRIPEGVTPEYEDQYAVYGSKLYFVGYDGSLQELTEYSSVPAPENTEEKKNYESSSDLSGITITPDGKLIVIENVYESWYTGEGEVERYSDEYYANMASQSANYIRTLDESGRELSCAKIDLPPEAYLFAYNMFIDPDGSAIVPGENAIYKIAPDGKIVSKIEMKGYPDSIFQLADGTGYVTVWGDSSEQAIKLDFDAEGEAETIDLPMGAYSPVGGGKDYDIYYNDGSYLCAVNLGETEPVRLFNWLNCDINGGTVDKFRVNEDGSISMILGTYNQLDEAYTVELAKISKVKSSELPKKQTLTLATQGVDWDIRDLIVRFNRKSEDCRIEIIDYSEFNTEEDYQAGAKKMSTELIAGKVPDIIDLSNMPYTQLASKGLLEDLYPYIEVDGEFSKEDFFENVFRALEVNGKLYSTCSNFSINSLIGAASVVGDEPGWTYDDYYAALAEMPEGCTGLDVYAARPEILSACLALDLNHYVDWTEGKCNFNSDDFKQLLEFTATFPESFDWENYEWTEEDSTETRIAEGRQMLMNASIYSITDSRYIDYYFGGDATYIGYPTVTGTGNMLGTGSGYAMSATSEHKDQVWSFLRQFYLEENQANVWGLPTNRNVFNKLLEKEMTAEYLKNADGTYKLDDDGNRVVSPKGSIGSANGKVYSFYALTQEQADELLHVIETTDKISSGNEKIYEIVARHAQAYYAGDKSIDETVKLIQSEANIYVNEQR